MQKKRFIEIFVALSLFGIVLFLIMLLFQPKYSTWLVMEHNYDWQFSDFFRQIVYASDLKNIYFNTADAPFPPLAYCFFHILYRMNPIELPVTLGSWYQMQLNKWNLLLFLIIMIFIILGLAYIIKKLLYGISEKKINLFIVVILLSAPFLSGAIERGNIAILVLLLLLSSIYLRDSNSKISKELALIFIAIAAGLKIYPAIFGILYIKEKRYKEALRLLAYGIIFFFVPFIFTGGILGLKQYFDLLKMFSEHYSVRWTSIDCFTRSMWESFNLSGNINFICSLFQYILLILSLLCAFFTKNGTWKTCMFLSLLMSIFVPSSYRYTSIYMLIPLILLLKNMYSSAEIRKLDYIYLILFAFVYTIPIWAIKFEVDAAIFTPIYIIAVIGFVEETIIFFKFLKNKIKKTC